MKKYIKFGWFALALAGLAIVGSVSLARDGNWMNQLRGDVITKSASLKTSSIPLASELIVSREMTSKDSFIERTFGAVKDLFSKEPDKGVPLFRISNDPDARLKTYVARKYNIKNLAGMSSATVTGDLVTIHGHDFSKQGASGGMHTEMDIQRYLRDEKTKEMYRVIDVNENNELLPTARVTIRGFVLPRGSQEQQAGRPASEIIRSTKTLVVDFDQQSVARGGISELINRGLIGKARDLPRIDPSLLIIPYKALVVLIDTTGGAGGTLPTPAQIDAMIAPGIIHDYYAEQSFGKLDYQADVTPWFLVSSQPIPINEALPFLENYLTQNNINLADYDQIVFVTVKNQGNFVGSATIGKYPFLLPQSGNQYSIGETAMNIPSGSLSYAFTDKYITGFTAFQFIHIHETGHNLGVWHDNSYRCVGSSPVGRLIDCDHEEYGNYFSFMGNGAGFATHFSGIFKSILRWIPSQNQIWVHNTGTYDIGPIENNTAKVLFIDFDNNGNPEYVADARKPVGFDKSLNQNYTINLDGVFLYRTFLPYVGRLNSRIIDVYDLASHEDDTLTSGRLFTDPAFGITIKSDPLPNGNHRVSITKQPITCRQFQPGLANVYFDENNPAYDSRAETVSASFADINGEIPMGILGKVSIEDYLSCYTTTTLSVTLSLDGQTPSPLTVPMLSYTFYPWMLIGQIYIDLNINAQTLSLGPHTFTLEITNNVTGLSSTATLPFTLVP